MNRTDEIEIVVEDTTGLSTTDTETATVDSPGNGNGRERTDPGFDE